MNIGRTAMQATCAPVRPAVGAAFVCAGNYVHLDVLQSVDMTEPELDKGAIADAVRHDAKIERDEDVNEQIEQIDRLAEALAEDEPTDD